MIAVYPISYPNSVYNNNQKGKHKKQSVNYTMSRNKTMQIPLSYNLVHGKEKLLESYDYAKDYFENNYNSHKPVFGKAEDIKFVEKNENIKRNFCRFLVEKSEQEIKKLHNIKNLTPEQAEKLEGFNQIHDFFNEYLELIPENKAKIVSFSGKLQKKDESLCKNFVHAIAGTCSLISAGAGALNLGSGDAIFLRGIQIFMFYRMKQYLQVPLIASAEYTAKELFSGAVIGTEGAKILTDIVGGGLHITSALSGVSIASGGSSHAAIAGTEAAIHGSLSFMITEKMGRGYIKRVKNNSMTFKDQTIELGQYAAIKWVFGGDLLDIFDLDGMPTIENVSSPESIKTAYDALPDSTKEFMGNFADLLHNFDEKKLGISFAINFATNFIARRKSEDIDFKKTLSQSFKDAFIMTAIYDMFDYGVGETISSTAKDTITDIQKNLEQYPEAFRIFKNSEAEFFEHIDLNKLNTAEFQNQFKNRTFLAFISSMADHQLKDFVKACKTRKYAKHSQDINTLNGIYEKQKEKTNENSRKIAEQMALNEYLSGINIQKTDSAMIKKNNFGYGRVCGYEPLKQDLTLQFISPLILEKNNNDIYPPSAILLFGPTNTGKTNMAKALTEQGYCKQATLPLYFSDEKLVKKIDDIEKNAKDRFELKKQRTVIHIDEIEGLSKKTMALEKLKDIIEDENSRITVVGTTNQPKLIDRDLSEHFIKLYVGPAKREDINEILDNFLSDNNKKYCEEIVNILDSYQNGRYSNMQIINIAKNINSKNPNSISEIYEYLKTQKPEITNNDIVKYKEI